MKFEFIEPYEFEGKTYKELEIDFRKIDGSVIFAAEQEMRASGVISPIITFNYRFCCAVLTQICAQPEEFFMRMPGPMVVEIVSQVQNFLNNSGLIRTLRA